MSEPEPWLRGPVAGVSAELQPAAHSLLYAREQIEHACAQLDNDTLWRSPNGAAPIGFHLRHLAGSIMRMLTYARGESLSAEQRAQLDAEKLADASLDAREAARIARDAIDAALDFIRATQAATLEQPRFVGRKRLPSNVRGLIFEIALHTARHVGQIATSARIVR